MNYGFAGFVFTIVTFFILAFSGCSEPQIPSRVHSAPEDPIVRERMQKDAQFKTEDSPLVAQDRKRFHGLSYFPIDPALRFSAKLNRYPAPADVRLGTNTGEIRSGLRYGYFEFQVEGRTCRLQVYRLEEVPGDGGAQLFIPFRDSTSGRQTYTAGRYIDLKENTSGMYDLDFNRAYNPFCAYNNEFSCPVPPPENTLQVPIRAGEKRFH
jgi:uncharacterized protein (DUF1684 family)